MVAVVVMVVVVVAVVIVSNIPPENPSGKSYTGFEGYDEKSTAGERIRWSSQEYSSENLFMNIPQ